MMIYTSDVNLHDAAVSLDKLICFLYLAHNNISSWYFITDIPYLVSESEINYFEVKYGRTLWEPRKYVRDRSSSS